MPLGRPWVVKLLLGFSLLVVITFFVDLREVVRLVVRVPLWIYAAALVFKLGVNVAHAARWRRALRTQELRLPLWRGLRLIWVGSFLDLFLPGTLGGDAYRVYGTKPFASFVRSAAVVFMERYCGLLATFLAGVVVVGASDYPRQHPWLSVSITGMFVLLVAVLFSLADPRVERTVRGWADRLGAARIASWIAIGSDSLRGLLATPGPFAAMIFYSLLMRAGFGAQLYLFAVGLALEVDLVDLVVFLCLNAVVTAVPISLNGLGVREANLFAFFTYMGSSPAEAASLAILLAVWSYASRLPGGLLLRVGDRDPKPRNAASR